MSRFIIKTAAVFLLSAGAAFAHAPDAVHAAPTMSPAAMVTFNAAAYPFGLTSIPKSFTGGRIAANGAPTTVQTSQSDNLPNFPAGM